MSTFTWKCPSVFSIESILMCEVPLSHVSIQMNQWGVRYIELTIFPWYFVFSDFSLENILRNSTSFRNYLVQNLSIPAVNADDVIMHKLNVDEVKSRPWPSVPCVLSSFVPLISQWDLSTECGYQRNSCYSLFFIPTQFEMPFSFPLFFSLILSGEDCRAL